MGDDAALLAAAHALRADRVHGAMQLAMQAVRSAAELLDAASERDVSTVVRVLARARPSMVAIPNALALFLAPYAHGERRDEIAQRARMIQLAWVQEQQALIEQAATLVPSVPFLYSHSSHTRQTIIACKTRITHVVIPEGRPIDDGKLVATLLAQEGIAVTLITEAQIGWWLPQTQGVFVGADTVSPDGAVYNHMGTATLAALAQIQHIPVYSLTHSLKIAPYDRPDDVQEENDPAEVWANPPEGVTVRNMTFDCTPATQITIITERGTANAGKIAAASARHRAAWQQVGLA